eukprot:759076-Hanusia_phi.AAC.8
MEEWSAQCRLLLLMCKQVKLRTCHDEVQRKLEEEISSKIAVEKLLSKFSTVEQAPASYLDLLFPSCSSAPLSPLLLLPSVFFCFFSFVFVMSEGCRVEDPGSHQTAGVQERRHQPHEEACERPGQ